MRILVIDDNDDIRLLLSNIIRSEGFDLVEAASGPEALDLLAHDGHIDLALLDVQMPDMDGWDTLAAIRTIPSASNLRVILCTVKGRPEDLRRGWELGCDGYLSKPFDLIELVEEVRRVINRPEDEREATRREGVQLARERLLSQARAAGGAHLRPEKAGT